MVDELSKIKSIKIYPSVANFFLIELLNDKIKAEEIVQILRKQNIYIRNTDSMSSQFGNKFLRIAVKNRDSNRKIVSELEKVFSS